MNSNCSATNGSTILGIGRLCRSSRCRGRVFIVVGAVGGILGLTIVNSVGIVIYCRCRQDRRRQYKPPFPGVVYQKPKEEEVQEPTHFQSGAWSTEYHQGGKWHGPFPVTLSVNPQSMQIIGSGSDDVGVFTFNGVHSATTKQINMTKKHQFGTRADAFILFNVYKIKQKRKNIFFYFKNKSSRSIVSLFFHFKIKVECFFCFKRKVRKYEPYFYNKRKDRFFFFFSSSGEQSGESDGLLACVTGLDPSVRMDHIYGRKRITFWSSPKVIWGQEFESGVRFSRNLTGRPGSPWKSSFLKSGPRGANRYGKVESEHRSSRNLIDRPGNQWKST